MLDVSYKSHCKIPQLLATNKELTQKLTFLFILEITSLRINNLGSIKVKVGC